MLTTKILFVFEGERTEAIIAESLEKHILNRHQHLIIKSVFAADVYQLYREIEEDRDLDTFNLIKERNEKNAEILAGYQRKDFAEIYLFFDYDAHASLASRQDRLGNPVKDGDASAFPVFIHDYYGNERTKALCF